MSISHSNHRGRIRSALAVAGTAFVVSWSVAEQARQPVAAAQVSAGKQVAAKRTSSRPAARQASGHRLLRQAGGRRLLRQASGH